MNIAVIVSAGKNIGSGHFGRTLNLVKFLNKKIDVKINFITNTKSNNKIIYENNFKSDIVNFRDNKRIFKVNSITGLNKSPKY